MRKSPFLLDSFIVYIVYIIILIILSTSPHSHTFRQVNFPSCCFAIAKPPQSCAFSVRFSYCYRFELRVLFCWFCVDYTMIGVLSATRAHHVSRCDGAKTINTCPSCCCRPPHKALSVPVAAAGDAGDCDRASRPAPVWSARAHAPAPRPRTCCPVRFARDSVMRRSGYPLLCCIYRLNIQM